MWPDPTNSTEHQAINELPNLSFLNGRTDFSSFLLDRQSYVLTFWVSMEICEYKDLCALLPTLQFHQTCQIRPFLPLYTLFCFLEKSQVRLVLFICASTGSRETYQLPHHQWQMILSNPIAKGSDLERLASFHARIVAGLFLYRLCAGYWARHIMSVRQHFMLLLFFFNTTPIKFPTIFFTEHAF